MLPAFLGLLPFFIFISIGTIGGYFKLFDQKNARALNLFVFYVAIPALIIEIVSGHKSDYLNLELLGIYVLMQLIVGIASFYVTKVYFLKSLPESIIWALTVSLSNHVLLVYPISKTLFDQNVSMQVSSIIVMDILLLISIITFCLEYVTKKKITWWIFLKDLLKNPIILSIIFSLILNFQDIGIGSGKFYFTISSLANCTVPVGLFALGIILSQHLNNLISRLTLSIAFLKMALSPTLLIIFVFVFLDITQPSEYLGGLLVSIGPCGAMSLAYCAAYNVSPADFIKAIFVSTCLSLTCFFVLINQISAA